MSLARPDAREATPAASRRRSLLSVLLLLISGFLCGCGSTKSRMATEQLLVSDAVDEAVASLDFQALAGKNVFFDTRYLVNAKGVGFVNSEYIISSLRQQMMAADVRLKEKQDDAEYVVEARVGTLGSDGDEIVYGIPANKGLSEASAVLPNAPMMPSIPEISVARKESQLGAVKVAAFAYERKSGSPVWQSGIAKAKTTSQDVWLFGAGPFQRGTIHSGTAFVGNELTLAPVHKPGEIAATGKVPFQREYYFPRPAPILTPDAQERPVQATATEPVILPNQGADPVVADAAPPGKTSTPAQGPGSNPSPAPPPGLLPKQASP